MDSELIERLKAGQLLRKDPPITYLIDGKACVQEGAETWLDPHPICDEAAAAGIADNQRIAELCRDLLAAEGQAQEALAEVARLREYVREASNQFRFYEIGHLAKQTQDGDEKAYRNKQWADRGFALLEARAALTGGKP